MMAGSALSPPPEHGSIRFNGAGDPSASLCRTRATVSGVILYQLQLYPFNFNVVVKRKGEQEVRRGKNVTAAVDATTQHYSFS